MLTLLVAKFTTAWLKSVPNAEHNAEILASLLCTRPFIKKTTLIGHSLGGRIVLRATEILGELDVSQVESTVALAPAITPDELLFSKIARGSASKPTVFFSEDDSILKTVYRVGEWTQAHALGFEGVPKKFRRYVRQLDASKITGQQISHGDYPDNLAELLRSTNLSW